MVNVRQHATRKTVKIEVPHFSPRWVSFYHINIHTHTHNWIIIIYTAAQIELKVKRKTILCIHNCNGCPVNIFNCLAFMLCMLLLLLCCTYISLSTICILNYCTKLSVMSIFKTGWSTCASCCSDCMRVCRVTICFARRDDKIIMSVCRKKEIAIESTKSNDGQWMAVADRATPYHFVRCAQWRRNNNLN